MVEREAQPAGRPGRYEFDDVVVDGENYRVLKAGLPRVLGPRPFDLLLDLLRHPGRVVGKQELFDRVWTGVSVTDNALTRAVKDLRHALGDDARAPRYVETVARRGYRFVPPVRSVTPPPKLMLVVLPFLDLSEEPETYFCDGLTEELITQIAQLNPERLGVIARTSAMAYKGTAKPVAEIGRELGVDHVLEGSVRREGRRVRISAQLIDARDQSHLWADSYEDELRGILRAQRRVAEAVARGVRVELGPETQRPKPRSLHPDAFAAYLKGRYLWNRRNADSYREAIGAFQQAIGRAPGYAPAHVGLARCCLAFIVGLLPRAEAQPMAEAAIHRALDLDDGDAEAHAALGALESFEGDYPAAEQAFRRALVLNPSDAAVHHWYAMHYLVDLGRFREALEALRRAQALDPLALVFRADEAVVRYLNGEPLQALEQCRRVLELDPGFARAHLYAGWAHAQRDDLGPAIAALETARGLDDNAFAAGWLGYAYARAGDRMGATRILDQLQELSEGGREVSFFAALVHTGLGETDRALERLEQACEERSIGTRVMRYMPVFDGLRGHPRFQRIVRRSGPRLE